MKTIRIVQTILLLAGFYLTCSLQAITTQSINSKVKVASIIYDKNSGDPVAYLTAGDKQKLYIYDNTSKKEKFEDKFTSRSTPDKPMFLLSSPDADDSKIAVVGGEEIMVYKLNDSSQYSRISPIKKT